MTSLKYRSDIDGLRAVAVLGVVIYHAFPHALPGGFIGVDIFFVISGYLISGLLYKGHNAGSFSPFSFGEFYARRIRRLFPALITMLVITLAYGWLILLPDEFRQLGKHVAAGTLFIQNIVFWQESGYFDISANLKPLLHLWSLAVEEQFYIFFPPLLIVLWKKPKILVPALVVLLIATFILNVVMSAQNGVSDFFLTPYRAWEFLAGSLLAWWHFDKGHEEDVPLYRDAMSWIGAFLLILGMELIHKDQPLPGWRALLPVAGTLLMMEGGAGGLKGAWVNRKILSNPAVVWIGLISYPLYLFHWPALSFVHIVKGEHPNPGYIIGALVVSFVLTMLTYYFIERKIRHNKAKWIVPALVAVFLMVGLVGWGAVDGFIKPNASERVIDINHAIHDKNFYSGINQHASLIGEYSIGGTGLQTLFVGDSNMEQYMPRIVKLLKNNSEKSRGAIFITHTGWPALPNYLVISDSQKHSLMPSVEEKLGTEPGIDRVVMASIWPEYFLKNHHKNSVDGIPASEPKALENAMNDLGDMIRRLVLKDKKVIVVLSIPYGDSLSPRGLIDRGFTGISTRKKSSELYREEFLLNHGFIIGKVRKTASEAGAEVIDPLDYLCTNGICIAEDERGVPIRYDHAHLRSGYVRDHVKYLDRTVEP